MPASGRVQRFRCHVGAVRPNYGAQLPVDTQTAEVVGIPEGFEHRAPADQVGRIASRSAQTQGKDSHRPASTDVEVAWLPEGELVAIPRGLLHR